MGEFRVLVTGSRSRTSPSDGAAVLLGLRSVLVHYGVAPGDVTVVHGGARGIDRLAAQASFHLGMRVECWPAEWDRHGKSAGMIRNRAMVAAGAWVCLAWPLTKPGARSVGTLGCMQECQRAGIPVSPDPRWCPVDAVLTHPSGWGRVRRVEVGDDSGRGQHVWCSMPGYELPEGRRLHHVEVVGWLLTQTVTLVQQPGDPTPEQVRDALRELR